MCNIPAVFTATAGVQALLAMAVALAGALASRTGGKIFHPTRPPAATGLAVGPAVLLLTVLVSLDSGAFTVIQHTIPLKATLWNGTMVLWSNALVHLLAAVLAGHLLDRGWCRGTLAVGSALLLGACTLLGLEHPSGAGLIPILYVAGVSFYSVGLVYYPAATGRPGITALVYAVAGWLGSAAGIGVAEGANQVPPVALVAAAAVIYSALCLRPCGGGRLLVGLLAAGAMLWFTEGQSVKPSDQLSLGRATYISEGCIHCHSAFVRPHVPGDVLRWGPGSESAPAALGEPPLPGNRRQGPDLARVGNRRSPEWQRLHLQDPRAFNPDSRMPSYAHLFAPGNPRGAALVAYLSQSGAATSPARADLLADWQPARAESISPAQSRSLFLALCANCHGETGRGDGPLAHRLHTLPLDLTRLPAPEEAALGGERRLARVIKFGLPGSPMAGHEWLNDRQVNGLVRYLGSLRPPARSTRQGED